MGGVKDALWSVYGFWYRKGLDRSNRVAPADASEAVAAGKAVLVDCRERDELQAGMATPARWAATSELERDPEFWSRFVEGLPKDKAVIIYCAAGVRAGRIAVRLEKEGLETANAGGFKDWVAAGLPTRPPGPAEG